MLGILFLQTKPDALTEHRRKQVWSINKTRQQKVLKTVKLYSSFSYFILENIVVSLNQYIFIIYNWFIFINFK